MTANQKYFDSPLAADTLLRARGFDKNGARTGGIQSLAIVDLPAGSVLIRFQDPGKPPGQWWSTPHELSTIVNYFARSGSAFDTGRSQGKGVLHASFAIRHDWGGSSPLHLGSYIVSKLTCSLKAYHGEGDHAPDESQQSVQKAIRIVDESGRQRLVRQVFLPDAWEYPNAFARLHSGTGADSLLKLIATSRYPRFPFER